MARRRRHLDINLASLDRFYQAGRARHGSRRRHHECEVPMVDEPEGEVVTNSMHTS